MAQEIIISELDKLVAKKYLSETELNLWKAIPYRVENFAGAMLGEGGGPFPVPLTIRLRKKGLYRIWLGIYCHCWDAQKLRVRLSKDLCSQKIGPPEEARENCPAGLKSILYEIFWKEADLTGQDLILAGSDNLLAEPGALAYIRLEPIAEISAPPKRKMVYPLAITNDGFGIFGESLHSRPEDLLESFENIPAESCLRILIWGIAGADGCNYPTKVGTYFQGNFGNSPRRLNRVWSRNVNLWERKGWDSLELMRKYTRKRKWEFQVYIRMEAFAAQFPWDWTAHSNFFYAHPEYHCFDREGQRVGRLSYACPEVQEHMLDLIAEIAAYNPDGICLCFIRGIPLVLYEPIMVEGFKKKHGIDPRKLAESDPRWLDYQAGVINTFMRRAKNVLKSRQRLSVIVPGNEVDCKRWGLDVAAWVKEGIVDDLFPAGQRFNKQDVHHDDPDNLDFRYFKQLAGRKKIRLIPMLYPWDKFNKDYPGWRQLMYSFLDRGADGYGVWDATENLTFSRVGDIGYVPRSKAVPPKIKFKKIKLLSMNGFRMDRYHYFEVV